MLMAGLLSAGCALIRVGPPTTIQDINPEEDARKNLEAVRAFQADRQRSSSQPQAPDSLPHTPESEEPVQSSIPSSVAPVVPTDDPRNSVPWTPPSVSNQPNSPAYKVPAPVGPDCQGTIRCVPDGMGGQRCKPH
jgi:hypothetical protein